MLIELFSIKRTTGHGQGRAGTGRDRPVQTRSAASDCAARCTGARLYRICRRGRRALTGDNRNWTCKPRQAPYLGAAVGDRCAPLVACTAPCHRWVHHTSLPSPVQHCIHMYIPTSGRWVGQQPTLKPEAHGCGWPDTHSDSRASFTSLVHPSRGESALPGGSRANVRWPNSPHSSSLSHTPASRSAALPKSARLPSAEIRSRTAPPAP